MEVYGASLARFRDMPQMYWWISMRCYLRLLTTVIDSKKNADVILVRFSHTASPFVAVRRARNFNTHPIHVNIYMK